MNEIKCPICNSEKVVYALVGIFCHDCDKLHQDDNTREDFTKFLINGDKTKNE